MQGNFMYNLQHILLPQYIVRRRVAREISRKVPFKIANASPFSRKVFRQLAFAHCRLFQSAKKAGIDPMHYEHSLNSMSVKKGKPNPMFICYERRVEEFERIVSNKCIADSDAYLPRDIKFAALQAYLAFPAAKGYMHEAHLLDKTPTSSEDARFLSNVILRFRILKILIVVSAPLFALSTFLQFTIEYNAALTVLFAVSLLGAAWGVGDFIYAGLGMQDVQSRYAKKIFDAAAGALEGKHANGIHIKPGVKIKNGSGHPCLGT